MQKFKLKEYSNILSLRKLGADLRELVKNQDATDESGITEIDFSDIDVMTHSFSDEFIAKLVESIGIDKFRHKYKIKNANEDFQKIIKFSISQRLKKQKEK